MACWPAPTRRVYSSSVIGTVAGSSSVRAVSLNWSHPMAPSPPKMLPADEPAKGFAWTTLRVYELVASRRG